MKNINKNEIQVKEAGEPNSQSPSLKKTPQKHHTIAIAAIFSLIILHFVSQFFLFGDENFRLEKSAVTVENEQIAEIKPAAEEVKNLDVVAKPNPVLPIAQPQPKAAPSQRTVIKKREPRETRAERLRRAEKILTGV